MNEEFKQKHAAEVELAKRELARRSHDTIRVYNPLEHSFRFMYDRYWHTVPAKGYKDLERFLAMKYFQKIADYMIGLQINKKGEALKELRVKQMGIQILDKYEENVQIWDKVPKLNDPELVREIYKVVIVGLVEEYGMDEPEPENRIPDEPFDNRPLHERIFSETEKRVEVNTIHEPETTPPPVNTIEDLMKGKQVDSTKELKPLSPPLKKKLAEEVTA